MVRAIDLFSGSFSAFLYFGQGWEEPISPLSHFLWLRVGRDTLVKNNKGLNYNSTF